MDMSTGMSRRAFVALAGLATLGVAACGKAQDSQTQATTEPPLPEHLKTDGVDFSGVDKMEAVTDGATIDDLASKVASGELDGQNVKVAGTIAASTTSAPCAVQAEGGSTAIPFEVVSLRDTGTYPSEGAKCEVVGVVRQRGDGSREIVVPAWGLSVFSDPAEEEARKEEEAALTGDATEPAPATEGAAESESATEGA